MLGVNRIGSDGNGLVYEKSSVVISPDGPLLKPVVQGDEMDVLTLILKILFVIEKSFQLCVINVTHYTVSFVET